MRPENSLLGTDRVPQFGPVGTRIREGIQNPLREFVVSERFDNFRMLVRVKPSLMARLSFLCIRRDNKNEGEQKYQGYIQLDFLI